MSSATGYDYGSATLPVSPVTMVELEQLKSSLLWSDADAAALARAAEILVPQTEDILDVWYGFIGANPHLVASFAGPDRQPNASYLAAVRGRFARWIEDVCTRSYDEDWLAYQEEIGRRHHPSGKNRTDGVVSPASHIELRHLIALIVPVTITIKDFLAKRGASATDVETMHAAWFKAVTLSVLLWTRPYAPELW